MILSPYSVLNFLLIDLLILFLLALLSWFQTFLVTSLILQQLYFFNNTWKLEYSPIDRFIFLLVFSLTISFIICYFVILFFLSLLASYLMSSMTYVSHITLLHLCHELFFKKIQIGKFRKIPPKRKINR